jgi:hypothetical protein
MNHAATFDPMEPGVAVDRLQLREFQDEHGMGALALGRLAIAELRTCP